MLTVTPTAAGATYGDAVPTLSAYTVDTTGYLSAADQTADAVSGTLAYTTNYTQGSGVGSYNITYNSGTSGTLTDALGYGFTYANHANGLTVGTKTVTVTLTGTVDKTYDTTLAATLAAGNYQISSLYGSDSVSVSNTSATYDTADFGSGKTISVSGLSISGGAAANYILSSTSARAPSGRSTRQPSPSPPPTSRALPAMRIRRSPAPSAVSRAATIPRYSSARRFACHRRRCGVPAGSYAITASGAEPTELRLQ